VAVCQSSQSPQPGQSLALDGLAIVAAYAGDIDTALELQRRAQQIPGLPGWMTRNRSTILATWLIETGELALAEDICAEGLAQSRAAGDTWNVACQLIELANLDRRAGRMKDAAAHLWEATQIVARTGIWFELDNILECCGDLCAAAGRYAEALTLWAAMAALSPSAVTQTIYWVTRRREVQREARHALGPDRARTAEERGAAMSRAVVIEKQYQPLASFESPRAIISIEDSIASEALDGDASLQVKHLLPDTMPFDFAVNSMVYQPGAALSMVEMHVMEHGLLMLEGGGIYRLGDSWYPVTAGDFIWMAPWCPQWFGALGKMPAKYLIYKDWNR